MVGPLGHVVLAGSEEWGRGDKINSGTCEFNQLIMPR